MVIPYRGNNNDSSFSKDVGRQNYKVGISQALTNCYNNNTWSTLIMRNGSPVSGLSNIIVGECVNLSI